MVSGVIVKLVNRLNIDQEVHVYKIYIHRLAETILSRLASINYYRLQSVL